MLLSGPIARKEAYYYDRNKMKFVPTDMASDEEKREIEECNERHERAHIEAVRERRGAEKRLKALREKIGPEEFDRLMDGVRYKKP